MLVNLLDRPIQPVVSYRGFMIQPEDIENQFLGSLSTSLPVGASEMILGYMKYSGTIISSKTDVELMYKTYSQGVDGGVISVFNPLKPDDSIINFVSKTYMKSFSFNVAKSFLNTLSKLVAEKKIPEVYLFRNTRDQIAQLEETVLQLPAYVRSLSVTPADKKQNTAAFIIPAAIGLAAGFFF